MITHCLNCMKKKKKRYFLFGKLVCKNKGCDMHYNSERLKIAQKRSPETQKEQANKILNYLEIDRMLYGTTNLFRALSKVITRDPKKPEKTEGLDPEEVVEIDKEMIEKYRQDKDKKDDTTSN